MHGGGKMNAKSPKGRDTRQRIIETAVNLFHKDGIYATSPDDIIEASGTGKGQFYYYFKNKMGLVHAVFQSHLEAIRDGTGPINYDIDTWNELGNWFQMHVELQKKFEMSRGCFFGTVGNELTSDDELVRQDLNLIFEVIRNKLAHFFSLEKNQERLKQDVDPVHMADFCIASVQGAMLMGKIKRDSGIVETTLREAFLHLRAYSLIADESAAPQKLVSADRYLSGTLA
jgi:TetR/AcrR family transcriptional regulator, transcriptional repressor for nem operon